MASIEIYVVTEDLGKILNEMREWLDHTKTSISHFRSSTDGAADGMVTIRVGFTQEDNHSEAFRQRFGSNGRPLQPD